MLTTRFEEALIYAARLHAGQVRKGTDIPYIAHLMGVASLVLEHGGDEDETIAALLHDAVEDQGGMQTLEEIRELYGELVATIVDGCTDAYGSPKPPWRRRKEAYFEKLWDAPAGVRLVSLADKLHNARAIMCELLDYGQDTWNKFNGGKEGTLWYYRCLADYFSSTGNDGMTRELERLVGQMEELSKVD